VAVDGGEADVGDVVDFAEAVHDTFANDAGMDFFAGVGHFFLQAVEEFFDLFLADGTFFARAPEAAFEFLAVVTFAGIVFLDDDEVCAFHTFKGGKAVLAFFAFAAAADFALFTRVARVEDGCFFIFAFWADHRLMIN